MKKILVTALLSMVWVCSAQALEMSATKTDTPPSINGEEDSVWSKASPLTLSLNELPYKPIPAYEGIIETEATLKALYDDQYLYFLVQWQDPTKSLERFPWVKQQDGSWKQQKVLDQTGHDNTYYEDKFAFLWNINQKGFAKKGCDKSCHMAENGVLEGVKDTSAGRHYTAKDSFIDIWHWKSARTNPVFQVDDQYINSDHNQNKGWGRHSDEKTAGGYKNNVNKDKSAPAYMNSTPSDDKYWVLTDNKTEFQDHFKPGDIVGGMVLEASQGSRGDITGHGQWNNGVWTLEIKRQLVTNWDNSSTQDVQFNDLSKVYHFGVTAFDNAQINHLFHKKPIKLTFEQ